MPSSEKVLSKVPAILLGGAENAVAAARALRALEVPVCVVAEDSAPAHHVRGATTERLGPLFGEEPLTDWLDGRGRAWEGAAVIPLSDVALKVLARDHAALLTRFQLARMDPAVVASMLDKEATVDLARAAGITVPRQWAVPASGEVDLEDLVFPLLVKPRNTFELLRRSGRKYVRADGPGDLRGALEQVEGLPGGVVLLEFIPGGDTHLASYNAVRHGGEALLEFTKRIVRRHPRNEGGATLHEMVVIPDVAEAGRRFFAHIGLEGLGNVEFKRDPRDGALRLIECNHRLTAATVLAERSGIEVVRAVYEQAIGQPRTFPRQDRQRWYWYPVRDLRSAAGDSRRALLSSASTALRRPVLPYWSWSEPGPSVRHARNGIGQALRRRRG